MISWRNPIPIVPRKPLAGRRSCGVVICGGDGGSCDGWRAMPCGVDSPPKGSNSSTGVEAPAITYKYPLNMHIQFHKLALMAANRLSEFHGRRLDPFLEYGPIRITPGLTGSSSKKPFWPALGLVYSCLPASCGYLFQSWRSSACAFSMSMSVRHGWSQQDVQFPHENLTESSSTCNRMDLFPGWQDPRNTPTRAGWQTAHSERTDNAAGSLSRWLSQRTP